jgi:hypothetical protein
MRDDCFDGLAALQLALPVRSRQTVATNTMDYSTELELVMKVRTLLYNSSMS